MSKSVNVDFVTRQIEVETDGKEHFISAAMAAKDAEQSMLNAQNAANTAEKIATDLGLVDEAVQTAVSSAEQASNSATTASNKADVATSKADIATTKASEASTSANTATEKADVASTSATNAAQSYANAYAVATQLTEYLATKETLTAPAVDKTLLIEGAAADSKTVGYFINEIDKNKYLIGGSIEFGFYNYTDPNTLIANSSYYSITVDVAKIPYVYITANMPTSEHGLAAVIFIDVNGNLIKKMYGYMDESGVCNETLIFVPNGAVTLRVCSNNSNVNVWTEKIYKLNTKSIIECKSCQNEQDIDNERSIFFTSNKNLNRTGQLVDSTDTSVSEFIELDEINILYRYGDGTKYGLNAVYYYDEKYNAIAVVSKGVDYEFETINGHTYSVRFDLTSAPLKAKYIRFAKNDSWYLEYKIIPNKVTCDLGYVNLKFKELDYIKSNISANTRDISRYKIVNFGDSIFGNTRPPYDISTTIANNTGATVYNCGFGGTQMGQHWSTDYDAFSMYRLAYSIAHNDFSIQDAVSMSGLPNYYSETLSLLKSIDFNEIDIVTIALGTNDFTDGDFLDRDTEKYNTGIFAGALRYSIEQILNAYPHIKIFICSPIYRFWIDESGAFIEDSDTKEVAGYTLVDFVNKTREVANEYHLPFIDNYNDVGFNKFTRKNYFPTNDGTHPNTKGTKLLGQHIASKLF